MSLKNIFSSKGVLGINARNLLYIRPYNSKKAIRMADDKIKTKQFLSARGIPVPKLFQIVKTPRELERFDFNSLPDSFVIKPNQGFGGEGIIPIMSKKGDVWVSVSGKEYTKNDFIDHIQDILDGRFSISNVGDYAFFEQYIVADERIGRYSYGGLPDIRVVVHNLIPVMAMLRLPTKESQGKANLHQGAVAVGIDIGKGEATHLAYRSKIIEELPDNLGKIRGLKIPYWDEILLIASKCQLVTNLGYLAADICLDKNIGPVLLEINARAGLGVQVANLAPLRRRLERIQGLKVQTPQKGIRIAKDMFGNTVEKEIAQISGKQIIGTEEEVEIIQKKGTIRLLAKISTASPRTILDEDIAKELNLLENHEDYDDEKSTLKLKFSLRKKRIQTVVDIEKILSPKYKMVIGKRDLKNFLIDSDVNKETKDKINPPLPQEENPPRIRQTNYVQIDQNLINIDNKIKLLFHLRPLNLEAEKQRFIANPKTNPNFEYPELKFDPVELVSALSKIECDRESALGRMFQKKKEEIGRKIALLEAIGEERFWEDSVRLFGQPTADDIEECQTLIQKSVAKEKEIAKHPEEILYNAEETKEKFEEVFKSYGLENWKVKIKEEMVANCVAGKNDSLFIRSDIMLPQERIDALIIHEIETHILTAENGKAQPYELFKRGFANYLLTQEGLAMYNVEKIRHIPFSENQRAVALVLAIDQAMKSSFSQTYAMLRDYGFSEEFSFRTTLKVKRGYYNTEEKGAFTKDLIYFRGYKQVKQFVEDGGDRKDLYLGKFNLDDLEAIKKIPGVVAPKILPKWLE